MATPRQKFAGGLIAVGALALATTTLRFRRTLNQGHERLSRYPMLTAELSFGPTTFIDEGNPADSAIMSMHGMFGGFDQAYDIAREHAAGCRIVAPSRFGYLGSAVRGDGSPADQVAANIELLDQLKIDKVFILGASAGGTAAIRFALDHPERTHGLILLSAAMPYASKPRRFAKYAGPPPFLCTAWAMFLLSPLFPAIMGLPASTIETMVPTAPRKEGVLLDASVANPDMARNFDDYPIERLRVPVLILQAKDDALAKYERTVGVLARFPDVEFVAFEDGGHLIMGHSDEVTRAIADFIKAHAHAH